MASIRTTLNNGAEHFNKLHTPGPEHHGLYNQGATCYLNSVLQVLFMTKEFREAVESNRPIQEEDTVDLQLKKLFTTLHEIKTNTKGISSILGIDDVYEQRDAAEYFEKILSMVNPEVSKIFKGQLRHITTCLGKHGHVTSDDFGPFWTLPLSITDPSDSYKTYSVKDGFKELFKSSTVSGENQIYCDECEKKADATIECKIEHHPENLTLLLKRFEFDYYSMSYVKINCCVDVPHTLQTEKCEYELYAIVDHFGSLRGGHYTAKIKSFDDDNWYEFNDSYVTKLQPAPLIESSWSAYLLVYRKSHADRENHGTNHVHGSLREDGVTEAGEYVQIKTSGDDDHSVDGNKGQGQHVAVRRKEHLGKADTGRNYDDLIERRKEDAVYRREDVDETRRYDVVLITEKQQTPEICRKLGKLRVFYHDYILPIRYSSSIEEDNVVEKMEQNDVVRRVDKDREGVVVKGETHLGETKTSLTKYGESSSSTNRCETIPSHPSYIPQEFNEIRRKAMQRRKDEKTGKYSQVLANGLDNKLREVLERKKRNRAHCGFRRFWGVRVKHTKTIGRRVGMSKKK